MILQVSAEHVPDLANLSSRPFELGLPAIELANCY
eukprot:COSAG06_NODE_64154_length_260_cov_0.645963_2_plen_34_part_01